MKQYMKEVSRRNRTRRRRKLDTNNIRQYRHQKPDEFTIKTKSATSSITVETEDEINDNGIEGTKEEYIGKKDININ